MIQVWNHTKDFSTKIWLNSLPEPPCQLQAWWDHIIFSARSKSVPGMWFSFLKCSNEQRMITLSMSLFRSPTDNWFNTLDWNNTAHTAELDNGFNIVQECLPYSLSWRTSKAQTVQHHLWIKHSVSKSWGCRPVPKNEPMFPVWLGLIRRFRPPGLNSQQLTSTCQSGCLQSTVIAFPS